MNQIDTRTYSDYIITENYFNQDIPFQSASEMKILFTIIFERQHK